MPRGKTEATKLREAIRTEMRTQLAKASVRAYLTEKTRKATYKAHAQKPLTESLREHIGKAIDRIDPLEAIALGAAAFLIHETLSGATDLLQQIENNFPSGQLQGSFPYNIIPDLIWKAAGINQEPQTIPKNELILWTISIVCAFYVIRHGLSILDNGILSLAKGFLK